MAAHSDSFDPRCNPGDRIRLIREVQGRPVGTQGTFKRTISPILLCEIQFDKDEGNTVVERDDIRKIHCICQCVGEMVILIYDTEAGHGVLKAGTRVLVLSSQGHVHIQANKRKYTVSSQTKVILL